MANDIGHNPWIIDTAGATALLSSKVWVERVTWHEPTTANHNVEITDKNGNPIWSKEALAGGVGMDYEAEIGVVVNGVIVPTLDSGVLFIYVE